MLSKQRSVSGILDMIRMLGVLVEASKRAEELVGTLEAGLDEARKRADVLKKRPRVFFEEWDDLLISGIGWISELIEIARRHHIFADRRNHGAAKDRIVRWKRWSSERPIWSSAHGAVRNSGPSALRRGLASRKIPAVQNPGPAALTDGLTGLQKIIGRRGETRC
jgi:iron complex transport system substrate-binding protein